MYVLEHLGNNVWVRTGQNYQDLGHILQWRSAAIRPTCCCQWQWGIKIHIFQAFWLTGLIWYLRYLLMYIIIWFTLHCPKHYCNWRPTMPQWWRRWPGREMANCRTWRQDMLGRCQRLWLLPPTTRTLALECLNMMSMLWLLIRLMKRNSWYQNMKVKLPIFIRNNIVSSAVGSWQFMKNSRQQIAFQKEHFPDLTQVSPCHHSQKCQHFKKVSPSLLVLKWSRCTTWEFQLPKSWIFVNIPLEMKHYHRDYKPPCLCIPIICVESFSWLMPRFNVILVFKETSLSSAKDLQNFISLH